jgi:hypothetical protein
MAHGILLSDQDFINDLIKINFQAVLGCKLAVVNTLDKMQTLLELDSTHDVIIAMTSIGNRDISKVVIKLCTDYVPEAHVFLLGHTTEDLPSRQFHSFKNTLDVLELTKKATEILNIKNASIPKMGEKDYFPIPFSLVKKLSSASQDFYTPDANGVGYIKLAQEGEPIQQKIDLWEKNKLTVVYVKKEHKDSAVKLLTQELLQQLSTALTGEESKVHAESLINSKQNLIDQVGEVFHKVFEDPESFSSLNAETKTALSKTALATEKMIRKTVATLPPNLNKLVELFQKGKMSYIQRHSLLVNFLCLEMSRKQSWFSTQVYATITMLTFFHDIVLTTIYIKHPHAPSSEFGLLEMEGLSENEKNLIKFHPKVIAQMIGTLPGLPIGLDQLILQHHGNTTGVLENKPPLEDIAPLSKLLYVAEKVAERMLTQKIPMSEELKIQILQEVETIVVKKSYQKLLQPLYELNL